MTKREEVLADIGKEVTKQVANNITREMKGDGLVGAQKELNETLNEIIARQARVKVQLFRVDPINPTVERYVSTLENIDPSLLLENGLEATVKAWCGGGKYRVKLQAEGIKEKVQGIEIEGDPLPPVPERNLRVPQNALMTLGPGQFQAGPGFAGLLGLPQPAPAPADTAATKAMGAMENITSVMLAKILGGDDDRRSSRESDELRALREMVADLKREKEIAAATAAHQREMAELNAKLEKMAAAMEKPAVAPQEGTFEKVLALATAVLPAALQAKSAADAAQMQLLTSVLAMSKNDGQKELVQALLSKPDQSDQMLKVYEAMGSMMGTSVQLTQGIINQMASLQGDSRPWYQEVALQLASSIGDVAQAVMSKSEPVKVKAEVRRVDDVQDVELDEAASAAAAAAQQQLEAAQQPEQLAGIVGPSRKDPKYAGDFFVKVFSLIEGDAPAPEVAFRVWKHATSGDTEALAWVRDPEGYTAQMLLGFVQRREMDMTEERFDAIVAAMVDLHDHFRNGGTAEAYCQHYGVRIGLPKRVHVVPVEKATDEEIAAAKAEAAGTATHDAPAAPAEPEEEDAPAPAPTVATPGLDRVPPPPQKQAVAAVGPERVPPPSSPMPPASASIPTEPKA